MTTETERFRQHEQNYSTVAEQSADIFHARQDPKLFAELEQRLDEYTDFTKAHIRGILSNARLAMSFVPIAEDDYSQIGNTRFGGLPDLPPQIDWPCIDNSKMQEKEHCPFLAQINLAELCGMQSYLPHSGMLYFFIHSQMDCPMIAQVLYWDGNTSALRSAQSLNIQPEDIVDFLEVGELKPARVRFFSHISILNTYSLYANYPPMNCQYKEYGPEDIFEQIETINYRLQGNNSNALHSINANVFTQCGTPQENAAQALGGKPEDYMVLLCIDSDQDISRFCFGDAGTLYFVIASVFVCATKCQTADIGTSV